MWCSSWVRAAVSSSDRSRCMARIWGRDRPTRRLRRGGTDGEGKNTEGARYLQGVQCHRQIRLRVNRLRTVRTAAHFVAVCLVLVDPPKAHIVRVPPVSPGYLRQDAML